MKNGKVAGTPALRSRDSQFGVGTLATFRLLELFELVVILDGHHLESLLECLDQLVLDEINLPAGQPFQSFIHANYFAVLFCFVSFSVRFCSDDVVLTLCRESLTSTVLLSPNEDSDFFHSQ